MHTTQQAMTLQELVWGKVGGKGLWAALDCVGGETTRLVSAATRPGGSIIIYGALAGPTLQLNILDVFLGKKLQVGGGLVLRLLSSSCAVLPNPGTLDKVFAKKALLWCSKVLTKYTARPTSLPL